MKMPKIEYDGLYFWKTKGKWHIWNKNQLLQLRDSEKEFSDLLESIWRQKQLAIATIIQSLTNH